jgi:hypothetical protein
VYSSHCVVRCLGVAAAVLSSAGVALAQTAVLEPFETVPSTWLVASDVAGGGQVAPTAAPVASGVGAARLTTSAANGVAQIRTSFTDAAGAHTWNERPGTFRWQRTSVYVPAATVAALGASDAMTLAGFWPSATPSQGWFLRVRAGGQLFVVGTRDSGATSEFRVFATVPVDRWFTLELGLHSQLGPGVKRAFAVFIDGVAHGWFRQGRMVSENYDRVAVGILGTTVAAPLQVVVDDWGVAGTTSAPTGPDARSTASLVAKDFRSGSGAGWQIDWSTWANDLRLDPTFGLYSNLDRLQAGVNHDRAPSFANGWGEIEIDWPKGRPIDVRPTGYFGPMIGFRKEINREQNLEVIPIGNGDGTVDLVFEAWDGLGPTILARAPLPVASFGGASIPEPGDIIRARWTQVTPTALEVRASYFDASAGTWAHDLIAGVYDISAISGVNFTDGFHTASSVTIDSPFYAIRRYHVGTLDTYPGAAAPPPPPLPSLQIGNASATEGTATPGVASFVVTLSAPSPLPVQVDYTTVAGSAAAGTDFVAIAGTATIAVGALTTTIPVTLVADAVDRGISGHAVQPAERGPRRRGWRRHHRGRRCARWPDRHDHRHHRRRRRRQRGRHDADSHRVDGVRGHRQRQQLRWPAVRRRPGSAWRDGHVGARRGACRLHPVERDAVRVGRRGQRQRRGVQRHQPAIPARAGCGARGALDQSAVGGRHVVRPRPARAVASRCRRPARLGVR